MQLSQFKREKWQADALAQELTDLDYLDWNEKFTFKYPKWRAAIDEHAAEYHKLKSFDPMSEVLFESVDQLNRVHDIMLDQIWKISRITNQIIGEDYFLEGTESTEAPARSAEDMGEASSDLSY
ncbi:hypothetical protein [Vibrio phage VCPH]|nr:hypothetical protein [Vibrio phage VCPH]